MVLGLYRLFLAVALTSCFSLFWLPLGIIGSFVASYSLVDSSQTPSQSVSCLASHLVRQCCGRIALAFARHYPLVVAQSLAQFIRYLPVTFRRLYPHPSLPRPSKSYLSGHPKTLLPPNSCMLSSCALICIVAPRHVLTSLYPILFVFPVSLIAYLTCQCLVRRMWNLQCCAWCICGVGVDMRSTDGSCLRCFGTNGALQAYGNDRLVKLEVPYKSKLSVCLVALSAAGCGHSIPQQFRCCYQLPSVRNCGLQRIILAESQMRSAHDPPPCFVELKQTADFRRMRTRVGGEQGPGKCNGRSRWMLVPTYK